jgi:hypothetical protein
MLSAPWRANFDREAEAVVHAHGYNMRMSFDFVNVASVAA